MENPIIPSVVKDSNDHRCDCGQLLAQLTNAGVEIKCKRCKRLTIIPWQNVTKDALEGAKKWPTEN